MAQWILEKVKNPRFPFLLRIVGKDSTLLCLRVQSRWPGPGAQIFCLRADPAEMAEVERAEVERVSVVSLRRYGKRLAVVLDRTLRKRCDFLFLTKPYKNRPGDYEQIFWRTQQSLNERRPRVKLTARGHPQLRIAIDANERYAWRFPGCVVFRENLPSGDYALMEGNLIKAVVERKTLANVLHHFGKMAVLHQVIGELEAYPFSALVIEASYSDLLKPSLVAPYTPSFCSKAIAEIFAFHPKLQIVFAGNRKLANEWTMRFFSAISAHEMDTPQGLVAEAEAQYRPTRDFGGGAYFEAMEAIQREMPERFTWAQLKASLPHIPESALKRALLRLKREGSVLCHKAGPKSFWEKRQREDFS